MTKTSVELPRPAAVLLEKCPAPKLVPTKEVRNIVDNGEAWKGAAQFCFVLHTCLVEWYEVAASIVSGKPTSAVLTPECGKFK